jgi:DNA mismatch repair ATPase MutS
MNPINPMNTPGSPELSLLWPPGIETTTRGTGLSASTQRDLSLGPVLDALCAGYVRAADLQELLATLTTDLDVIRFRQDVLEDLLDAPALVARFEAFLPKANALDRYVYFPSRDQTPLHEVIWRIGQLELYVECVQILYATCESAGAAMRSAGLRRLRDVIKQIHDDPQFDQLARTLPDLAAQVRGAVSVTIGVNLDDSLRPVEATLLAVNKQRFHGASFSLIGALLGRSGPQDEWEGIAQLHAMPRPTAVTSSMGLDNPMLHPLFRDLADVLKQVTKPVAAALERYQRINVRFLDRLRTDLAFYLGAARLIERLRRSGLPVCKPELAPAEDRICEVEDAYNVYLALRLMGTDAARPIGGAMVLNDVWFGETGRILILTGPNRGGKTTYTQAVGLIHVLAQAGLHVPGSRARISPVDAIYTHFPVEEDPQAEAGRLGEEAQRLSVIFERATRYSLILLNESLATTSPGEGLYLARDLVRALRLLGARAIYATHLHELAADLDDLNESTPGDSAAASLVARVLESSETGNGVRQTYKIVPGPPLGKSYAREIASRYGISFEQLQHRLHERGINGS